MRNIKNRLFFSFSSAPIAWIFLVLIANLYSSQIAVAQKGQAFTLEINGIVKDDDNGRAIEGAIVKVTTLTGQTVESNTTANSGKFKFILEPNKEFLITANKPGYTGKIVSINTKDVDVNAGTLNYYKFPISISIFKEVPGLDVSVLKSPIGAIFYNQTSKDFDYTADKFLREAMEKLVKDIEKKKMELEAKKKKEEDELNNKAKIDAQLKAEAQAAAKKQAEEDAKNKLKSDAKAKADAEAEAKRKLIATDEAKRKADEDAKKQAEEDAKSKAKQAADAVAAAKKQVEEAAKAKAAAQAEADLKRREEARLKAEDDAKVKAEAKAIENAQRKSDAEAKRLALEEAKKIYVIEIEYDTEEGANYIISKTIITKTNDEKLVYKRIIYNWGGIYFKKDDADITEQSFITELKNIVVKTN